MPIDSPTLWVGWDSPDGRAHAMEAPTSAVGLCGADVGHPEDREWRPNMAKACGDCSAKVDQRRADTED